MRKPNKNRKVKIVECLCGCGESFNKYDGRNRERKYIHYHNMKEPWNKGLKKRETITTIIPRNVLIGIASKGKHSPNEFKKGHTPWNKGVYGEDNVLFDKNSVTPLRKLVEQLPQYMEWRKKVLERDNFQCVNCGVGGNLEIHHILPFKDIVIEYSLKTTKDAVNCSILWGIDNGIALCNSCHRKVG